MISEELLSYIRSQQEQGVSNEDIKKALRAKGGWDKSDLDEAFNVIDDDSGNSKGKTSSARQSQSETAQTPSGGALKSVLLIVGVVVGAGAVVGGAAAAYMYLGGEDRAPEEVLASAYTNLLSVSSLAYDGTVTAETKDGAASYELSAAGVTDVGKTLVDTTMRTDVSVTWNEGESNSFFRGTSENSIEFEARFVDGIGYLHIESLPQALSMFLSLPQQQWIHNELQNIEEKSGITVEEVSMLGGSKHAREALRLAGEHNVYSVEESSGEIDGQEMYVYGITFRPENLDSYATALVSYIENSEDISGDVKQRASAFVTQTKEMSQAQRDRLAMQAENTDLEVWISKDDLHPHNLSLSYEPPMESNTSSFGVTPGGMQITAEVELTLSDFNEPVSVEAPEDSVDIETVRQQMMEESGTGSLESLLNMRGSTSESAAIQSRLSQLRAEAEIFYSNNKSSYAGFCAQEEVAEAAEAIETDLSCEASTSSYVIFAPLPEEESDLFCVDSTGFAQSISETPQNLSCS